MNLKNLRNFGLMFECILNKIHDYFIVPLIQEIHAVIDDVISVMAVV